jgi:hypothetical protein
MGYSFLPSSVLIPHLNVMLNPGYVILNLVQNLLGLGPSRHL